MRIFRGCEKDVNCIVLSTDDKYLFSGSDDTSIIQWQVCDGSILKKYEGHTNYICFLALSANNNVLVSGSNDSLVLVWDV